MSHASVGRFDCPSIHHLVRPPPPLGASCAAKTKQKAIHHPNHPNQPPPTLHTPIYLRIPTIHPPPPTPTYIYPRTRRHGEDDADVLVDVVRVDPLAGQVHVPCGHADHHLVGLRLRVGCWRVLGRRGQWGVLGCVDLFWGREDEI